MPLPAIQSPAYYRTSIIFIVATFVPGGEPVEIHARRQTGGLELSFMLACRAELTIDQHRHPLSEDIVHFERDLRSLPDREADLRAWG